MVIETTHGRYGLYDCREIIAAPADNNQFRYLVHGGGRSAGKFAIGDGLLDGLALAVALLQKMEVVLHVFVGGILALGGRKGCVRALVVATQHV